MFIWFNWYLWLPNKLLVNCLVNNFISFTNSACGLIFYSWNPIHVLTKILLKLYCNHHLACVTCLIINVYAAGEDLASTKQRLGGQRTAKRYTKSTMFEAQTSLRAKHHAGERVLVHLFYNLRKIDGGKFSINTFCCSEHHFRKSRIWKEPGTLFELHCLSLFPSIFSPFLLS